MPLQGRRDCHDRRSAPSGYISSAALPTIRPSCRATSVGGREMVLEAVEREMILSQQAKHCVSIGWARCLDACLYTHDHRPACTGTWLG